MSAFGTHTLGFRASGRLRNGDSDLASGAPGNRCRVAASLWNDDHVYSHPARQLRRLIVGTVLTVSVVALVACGSTNSGSTTRTTDAPVPSGPATERCGVVASAGVVVNPGTEPCTAVMDSGFTAHIELRRGFTWGDPVTDTVSDPVTGTDTVTDTVSDTGTGTGTVRVSSITRPADGGLRAKILAVHTGRATVTASGGVACDPGKACPALARVWTLFVEVR